MVRIGEEQVLEVPEPVDQNSPTATDYAIIRAEVVKAMRKM
jgi:hypothetical protein